MLKKLGKLSQRFFCGYASSDGELRVDPHLRGVVIRGLPGDIPINDLNNELSTRFKSELVDIKKDIKGLPAYAIVRFQEEKDCLERCLQLNFKTGCHHSGSGCGTWHRLQVQLE